MRTKVYWKEDWNVVWLPVKLTVIVSVVLLPFGTGLVPVGVKLLAVEETPGPETCMRLIVTSAVPLLET